jgi:hypothetical protein
MGIEAQFSIADVQKRFDAFLDQIVKQQIKCAQGLGEMCVNHARSIPKEQGFEDQTGNLRSSIGYMVFVDGVAIHSFYNQVKEGSTGVKAGEALAKKIGQDQRGVCLVVTAGMNYALYLETKGRDVLTGAEHVAERELPRMLEELVANIQRAAE